MIPCRIYVFEFHQVRTWFSIRGTRLYVVGAGNPISDVGDLLYGEHVVAGYFNAVVECSLINGLLCFPARAIVQIIPRNYIRGDVKSKTLQRAL